MNNQLIIATSIVENNNKYLLLKRSKSNRTNKGKWQFPEGKIEFGEEPIKALERELKEETNLNLINANARNITSSVINYPKYGKYHLIRLIFNCKVSGKIALSEEHYKFGWFSKNKIKNMKIVNGTGNIL
ncbi:MAG: NUDIX domain-containing protein [Nanoarchaeota archaeon]|nr:NUDIX domain-containing protein [Nanoarchaeota archaeon]